MAEWIQDFGKGDRCWPGDAIGKAPIPHRFSIELSKPRLISTKLLLQKQTAQRVHKKAKKRTTSVKKKELRELRYVDCGEN